MRIIAMADIHGNYQVYKRIPNLADESKVDAVVIAGDLLGVPDGFQTVEEAQRSDANHILEILKPLEVPLLYIMGNDDLVELEPGKKNFHNIHGRRIDFDLFNFIGYQYSLPFVAGVYEKPEEEIAKDLTVLESLMDDKTIFVTHNPAKGVLDRGIMDILAGSTSILSVINNRSVRAHIHGHIHSSFGRQGRHFNVAGGCELRGMIIDLMTLEHKVIDVS